MVTELQFVAVAVFLIWGLVASLCGVLTADPDAARLVWRHRDSKPEAPTAELDQRGLRIRPCRRCLAQPADRPVAGGPRNLAAGIGAARDQDV